MPMATATRLLTLGAALCLLVDQARSFTSVDDPATPGCSKEGLNDNCPESMMAEFDGNMSAICPSRCGKWLVSMNCSKGMTDKGAALDKDTQEAIIPLAQFCSPAKAGCEVAGLLKNCVETDGGTSQGKPFWEVSGPVQTSFCATVCGKWLISNNCQNGVDGLPEDEGDVVLKIGDVIATCENIKQNYEGAEQN